MTARCRLVIGAGGTGRTHLLHQWVAEMNADVPGAAVAHLAGAPGRPVSENELRSAVDGGATMVVADDVQWFESGAVHALIEMVDQIPVLASRRPGRAHDASADALDHLVELLTRDRPATRLDRWGPDAYPTGLASIRSASGDGDRAGSTELIEALRAATAGSPGLTADCVAAGWDGTGDRLPAPLIDAVTTRIRRAGPGAGELAAAWAVLAEHDPATTVAPAQRLLPAEIDGDEAERHLRSGGLTGPDDQLIPVVRRAVLADLGAGRRAQLHDRAAAALARTDPVSAADHLLAGAGRLPDGAQILGAATLASSLTDPGRANRYIDRAGELGLGDSDCALLRALVSFHAGTPDVLAHLDEAESTANGSLSSRAALLSYGSDLRELRFADAARRDVGGDLAGPLSRLAALLDGHLDDTPTSDGDGADPAGLTPLARVVATTAGGLVALARGDAAGAVGQLTAAADDFDRLRPSAPLGFTPHGLGALAALQVGDLGAVDILTEQAIDHDSGGPGERLGHQLIRAYGRLVDGDYGDALALLRAHAPSSDGDDDGPGAGLSSAEPSTAGPPSDGAVGDRPGRAGDTAGPPMLLSQRDRLLLAALEAAIARRSGDTARLRASWRRTEAALLRLSASWLLGDVLLELLAAGARLEDNRRIDPVVRAVTEQTDRLPATGPGPVAGWWLRLQVAVSSDDGDGVTVAARDLAAAVDGTEPGDERSRVRLAAAGVWARVVGRSAGETEVTSVAERLTAVGDGWEASRLLGRAALDEKDPKAARRLLELARVSTNERIEEAGSEGLGALGLSDREAEVAVLVAEGRTHKEIGGQLFISPKTVEHHVAKIRQKLGAGSRAELLAIVREATGQT